MALAYSWYDASPAASPILALLALTVSFACRLVRIPSWPLFLVAICLLGLWRYEITQPPAPLLPTNDGQTATLTGRISNDPEATSNRIKFALEVETTAGQATARDFGWEEQGGKVLVYAHPPPDLVHSRERPYYRFDDRLELTGTLQRPEPIKGFDYPAYLESKGIHGIFWAQKVAVLKEIGEPTGLPGSLQGLPNQFRGRIYELRRHLARTLDDSLPPSQAALAQALLLGLRGQLADEVTENFRQTGTSHLLAISGLHLGILLLMSLGLLHGLLGRHTPIPLALTVALVWVYVLVSGAPASVVRAAIMGSVFLFALGVGRPRENLSPALALSAILMTALDPKLVTQISFQLSFAAMAGIVLALPWQEAVSQGVANRFEGRRWLGASAVGVVAGWVLAAAIVSMAATLATFPLVALNFKQIPLLGIPATILATPLLPFALGGGMAVDLAGSIHPALGQLAGLPGSIPLTALLQLVEWMPKWTVATSGEPYPLTWAWYGLLLTLLVLAGSRTYRTQVLYRFRKALAADNTLPSEPGWERGMKPYVGLVAGCLMLVAGLAFLLVPALTPGDGRLRVHFLDVGQGDSIFIETPSGRQILIDGGPEFGGAALHLQNHLPWWDRSLDLLVATHLDADHSRGLLRVLDSYKVGTVAVGVADLESSLYPQWIKAVEQGNHAVAKLVAGQELALEEGITLRVLHPPSVPLRGPAWDSNNNSIVLKLDFGEISFLLTADIEAEAERYIVRNSLELESDVMKAAHHGSNSSSTATLLKTVNPRWAVISAGEDNQYGHPHPSVVSRLKEIVGEEGVFSTAAQGTIEFTTDGKRLWVKTEK